MGQIDVEGRSLVLQHGISNRRARGIYKVTEREKGYVKQNVVNTNHRYVFKTLPSRTILPATK